VNTFIGFGGILDPATELNIPNKKTDFGETLYTWGVPEGAYIELPLLGPSTERAAVGIFVDTLLDPMNRILPKGSSKYTLSATVLDKIGDRNDLAGLVEGVLYGSEDSYAAQRLIYLQNRRFSLSGRLSEDELEDPYAE
jgi:phospholipid-binding lipoprotein MlaA